MGQVSREDADAFIQERYRSIVETIARRLRVAEMEALDVAHDVVAAIYSSLESYDPEKGPFEAWVAGIVRNHVLRYMEGRGRRKPDPVEAEPALNPSDNLVLDEVRGFLFAAVDRQPQLYRDTLKMRYMEGKDLKEIARLLGVPLGTVKARLSRAPDMLKEGLQIQQTTMRFFLEKNKRKPE